MIVGWVFGFWSSLGSKWASGALFLLVLLLWWEEKAGKWGLSMATGAVIEQV
jgi:hypothetical protein